MRRRAAASRAGSSSISVYVRPRAHGGPRRGPPRHPQPSREAQRVQPRTWCAPSARRCARPPTTRAVRVVVLRGNGPVFSAGMDIATLGAAASSASQLRSFRRDCLDAWNLAEEMLKPTVCAIHGACLGGALELALACDLRVMAEDAVVGLPETRLGLVPDVGGSSRLPQIVGVGRAKELILTSRVIGAVDAERYGLVNRVGGRRRRRVGARRRAAGVRADRRGAGEAADRRVGPAGVVDDAGARGQPRRSSACGARTCARASRRRPRSDRLCGVACSSRAGLGASGYGRHR